MAAIWRLYALIPLNLFNAIAGFVMFRFFDIIKPWPIDLIEQRYTNAVGVMLDDLLAILPVMLILALFN